MDLKHVVKHIVLPYLPAKTLARFKTVSKEWEGWIKSPFLAHEQSHYFKNLSGFFSQYDGGFPIFVSLDDHAYGVPTPSLRFLPEHVNILSSCNGLLLCGSFDVINGSYYICNPANEEWEQLPRHGLYHTSETATVLAFEPSPLNMEANYELICAIPVLHEPSVSFELYSSKTRSWRILPTTVVELKDLYFTGNGFYMKGVAYWETTTRKVLAFGLESEQYEFISLPSETPWNGVLTQVQGELCYISISKLLENEYCIKIHTGMNLSLKFMVNVNLEPAPYVIPGYRVLPCFDGNVVMILVGGLIYSYSIGDQRIKLVTRLPNSIGFSTASKYLAYVNSLVNIEVEGSRIA